VPTHATIIITVLLLGSRASAQPLRDSLEYRVVERATTFSDSRVGDDADTPVAVHALRLLLARPDAAESLGDLVERAPRPAGRLFALAGLAEADPTAFARVANAWRGSDEPLGFMTGCSLYSATVGAVVRALEQGELTRRLCRDDRPASSVDALRESLRSTALDARRAAAWECMDLGPRAREALPDLLTCVEAADDELAAAALDAIEAQSYWAVEVAVPALHDLLVRATLSPARLIAVLRRIDRLVDGYALIEPRPSFVSPRGDGFALALPEGAEAALVRAVAGEDEDVRFEALSQLSELGSRVEPLLALLGDARADVREGALATATAIALRHADARARVAAAAHEALLRDGDEGVREAAQDALDTLR
jgi:hypothetical protein